MKKRGDVSNTSIKDLLGRIGELSDTRQGHPPLTTKTGRAQHKEAALKHQDHRCWLCREPFENTNGRIHCELDEITASNQYFGGPIAWSNCLYAHPRCNLHRSDTPWEDYVAPELLAEVQSLVFIWQGKNDPEGTTLYPSPALLQELYARTSKYQDELASELIGRLIPT